MHPELITIPLNSARQQINDGKTALEQMFGREITGFAYPFGTYDDGVCAAVRETGHIYARTVKDVPHCYPPEDPMQFHPNCHFLATDFLSRFESSHSNGVFYFWGHSYELVGEPAWEAFDQQVEFLANHPSVEWTWLPDLFAPVST